MTEAPAQLSATKPSVSPAAKWPTFNALLKTSKTDWSAFGSDKSFSVETITKSQLSWVITLLKLAGGFDEDDKLEARRVFDDGVSNPSEQFWVGLVSKALPGTLAGAAVKLGDALHKAEEFDAERILMELLKGSLPQFHWPHFALGRLDRADGNMFKALEHLETAARFDPKFGWCQSELYFVLYNLRRYEEAAVALEQAIEQLPAMRKTMARERLQLLSRIRWTPTHLNVLSDLLDQGPPSVATSEKLLELFGQLLAPDVRTPDSVRDCVAGVEQLFLRDKVDSLDFGLLPVLFLAATAIATEDPERAERLLAEFSQRLPAELNLSVLPDNFIHVITSAQTIYLQKLYVEPWNNSADLVTVNELIAELNLSHFNQAGFARMFCEAAAIQPRDAVQANALPLRIAALVGEMKWFEVLDLIRTRSPEDVANSSLLFKNFTAAVRAISDGSPGLKLCALHQIMALIDLARIRRKSCMAVWKPCTA